MTAAELGKKRIGVLMGGESAEREVSLASGNAVLAALSRRGYDAVAIEADRQVCSRLTAEGIELAFVALHGTYGEDGCVQGLLEVLRIPYTGSGVQSSAVAMDKVACKRMFDRLRLPTPPMCYPATVEGTAALGLPVVIKPRREGSSVGLTVAREKGQLAEAIERARDAIAERYVPGRELSVGVLGHGDEARVLGSVEIRPRDGLYDYEAKYETDDTVYICPAPVPDEVQRRMAAVALAAHRALECHGGTRCDFRHDDQHEPQLLELNTIPGMTDHSLLPKIAQQRGMTYDDLVEQLLLDARLKVAV